MEARYIAGIDYSLCGPAICVHEMEEGKPFSFRNCAFFFLTDSKSIVGQIMSNIRGELFNEWDHECERYDTIAEWAFDKVRACSQVALEDYAFAAKGRVFHIAENTGLLKYKLWQGSIPVEVISPTHVKKMATGKGNADKDMMHDSFRAESKVDLRLAITPGRTKPSSPVTDLVDSYYICKVLYGRLTGACPFPKSDSEDDPPLWQASDED